MTSSAPAISTTAKQARFEYLTAKLVIECALQGVVLICYRFISTLAEDLAHFKAGRSDIDPRITPTKHMLRLAKDYMVIKDGNVVWSRTPEYETLGAIAESLGLRWGGRFKSLQDIYHVEYRDGA